MASCVLHVFYRCIWGSLFHTRWKDTLLLFLICDTSPSGKVFSFSFSLILPQSAVVKDQLTCVHAGLIWRETQRNVKFGLPLWKSCYLVRSDDRDTEHRTAQKTEGCRVKAAALVFVCLAGVQPCEGLPPCPGVLSPCSLSGPHSHS